MAKRKTKDSIKLSPKHGVNPSVLHCFICDKEIGLALLGKLKDDAEAPHDISNPSELCDDYKKALEESKLEAMIYALGVLTGLIAFIIYYLAL